MRYHGDYHLGQVLLAKQDFLIVDFEGEPTRPFSERRRKHSPLRDIAGMARSFDYARWTVLRNVAQSPEEHERFAALAAAWHETSLETFLSAYDGAMQGSGHYASLADARALLALFQLEKALYELRYEINNRPGWVQVPLQGILALIDADRQGQTA
jgi:maltose alpha-D-glucosyltransferase/alpha-amylase